jgi:hypothetical protein
MTLLAIPLWKNDSGCRGAFVIEGFSSINRRGSWQLVLTLNYYKFWRGP